MRYADKKRVHDLLGPLILIGLLMALASPVLDLYRVAGGAALFCWLFRQWVWRSMRKHYVPSEANLSFSTDHLYHWFLILWLLFLAAIFIPGLCIVFGLASSLQTFQKFWIGIAVFIFGYTTITGWRLILEKREEERAKRFIKKAFKAAVRQSDFLKEKEISSRKSGLITKTNSSIKRQ